MSYKMELYAYSTANWMQLIQFYSFAAILIYLLSICSNPYIFNSFNFDSTEAVTTVSVIQAVLPDKSCQVFLGE